MGCSGSTQTKEQQQSSSPKQQAMNNAPQRKEVAGEDSLGEEKRPQEGVNDATLPPTDNKNIENHNAVTSPKEAEPDLDKEEKKDEEKPTTEEAKPADTRTADDNDDEAAKAAAAPESASAPETATEGTQEVKAPEQGTENSEATKQITEDVVSSTEERSTQSLAAQVTCDENSELAHQTAVESLDCSADSIQNSEQSQREQTTPTQETVVDLQKDKVSHNAAEAPEMDSTTERVTELAPEGAASPTTEGTADPTTETQTEVVEEMKQQSIPDEPKLDNATEDNIQNASEGAQ